MREVVGPLWETVAARAPPAKRPTKNTRTLDSAAPPVKRAGPRERRVHGRAGEVDPEDVHEHERQADRQARHTRVLCLVGRAQHRHHEDEGSVG